MYTIEDLNTEKKHTRNLYYLLAVPILLLTGSCVYGMVMHLNRNDSYQWLSYLSLLIAGLLVLFFDGLFIMPKRAYQRHLKDMLFGRNHELQVRFKHVDMDICVKDGVSFKHVIFSEGDDINNDENDRSFYFDIKKDFPAMSIGETVIVKSHDRRIIHITNTKPDCLY